jgi:hypothetical protein
VSEVPYGSSVGPLGMGALGPSPPSPCYEVLECLTRCIWARLGIGAIWDDLTSENHKNNFSMHHFWSRLRKWGAVKRPGCFAYFSLGEIGQYSGGGLHYCPHKLNSTLMNTPAHIEYSAMHTQGDRRGR